MQHALANNCVTRWLVAEQRWLGCARGGSAWYIPDELVNMVWYGRGGELHPYSAAPSIGGASPALAIFGKAADDRRS